MSSNVRSYVTSESIHGLNSLGLQPARLHYHAIALLLLHNPQLRTKFVITVFHVYYFKRKFRFLIQLSYMSFLSWCIHHNKYSSLNWTTKPGLQRLWCTPIIDSILLAFCRYHHPFATTGLNQWTSEALTFNKLSTPKNITVSVFWKPRLVGTTN